MTVRPLHDRARGEGLPARIRALDGGDVREATAAQHRQLQASADLTTFTQALPSARRLMLSAIVC